MSENLNWINFRQKGLREQCKVDWVAAGCWLQCRMRNQYDVVLVANCHTLKQCNSMTKTSATHTHTSNNGSQIYVQSKKRNLSRMFSHISIVVCALTSVRSSASYVRYWAMSYHFVFRQKVLMWCVSADSARDIIFRIFRKNPTITTSATHFCIVRPNHETSRNPYHSHSNRRYFTIVVQFRTFLFGANISVCLERSALTPYHKRAQWTAIKGDSHFISVILSVLLKLSWIAFRPSSCTASICTGNIQFYWSSTPPFLPSTHFRSTFLPQLQWHRTASRMHTQWVALEMRK